MNEEFGYEVPSSVKKAIDAGKRNPQQYESPATEVPDFHKNRNPKIVAKAAESQAARNAENVASVEEKGVDEALKMTTAKRRAAIMAEDDTSYTVKHEKRTKADAFFPEKMRAKTALGTKVEDPKTEKGFVLIDEPDATEVPDFALNRNPKIVAKAEESQAARDAAIKAKQEAEIKRGIDEAKLSIQEREHPETANMKAKIGTVSMAITWNAQQEEYVFSFPGLPKGNAFGIGSNPDNARKIFKEAIALASETITGAPQHPLGPPDMISAVRKMADAMSDDYQENDRRSNTATQEKPQSASTPVVVEEVPGPLGFTETPALHEEQAKAAKESEEIYNRETMVEQGARILQEKFYTMDATLDAQQQRLAARADVVNTKLGTFLAGAVGLGARAWEAAKNTSKGGVEVTVGTLKPTRNGGLYLAASEVFNENVRETFTSLHDQIADLVNKALNERRDRKAIEKMNDWISQRIQKQYDADKRMERYGTETPTITQRMSAWNEDRKIAKAAKVIEAQDKREIREVVAVQLAEEFAARGGDTFTEEEKKEIGAKLLKNKEIAGTVDAVASAIYIPQTADIIRANFDFAKLLSKIFSGAEDEEALEGKTPQQRYLTATPREWFVANIVEGTKGGARAFKDMLVDVGSTKVGKTDYVADMEAAEAREVDGVAPELSTWRKLLPTVFKIKDRMALRNAEVAENTLTVKERARNMMDKAYNRFILEVNVARLRSIDIPATHPLFRAIESFAAIEELPDSAIEMLTPKDVGYEKIEDFEDDIDPEDLEDDDGSEEPVRIAA